MDEKRKADGSVLKLPRRPDPARDEGGAKRIGENYFYPRRFYPYRDPAPFFLPILITVIGAILVIGAGWAVLHVHRAQSESQEAANPAP